MKSINKNIDILVNNSKNITSKKQAIEIAITHLYHLALTRKVQFSFRTSPFCEKITKVDPPITTTQQEDKLLTEIVAGIFNIYLKSEPFTDVLTELYGNVLNYKLGQHMTPADIAEALPEFMDTDNQIGEQLNSQNTISVFDPACGTGGLILGKCRYILKKYGEDTLSRIDLFVNDIDQKMCIATVANLELNSLIHQIPYNQLTVYNENALITGFDKDTEPFYLVIPNLMRHRKTRMLYEYEKQAA